MTTLSGLAPLLSPSLIKFQAAHPELIVRLLTGERVFRLEYGEAHVAVRAGPKPDEPDNVVQDFIPQRGGMYAARSYVEAHGVPTTEADIKRHRWICHDSDAARAPFDRWIRENVPPENIVFRATEAWVMQRALLDGAGIGFMPVFLAAKHPDLVQVLPATKAEKVSIARWPRTSGLRSTKRTKPATLPSGIL